MIKKQCDGSIPNLKATISVILISGGLEHSCGRSCIMIGHSVQTSHRNSSSDVFLDRIKLWIIQKFQFKQKVDVVHRFTWNANYVEKKKISFINPRICMCVLFRLFITCSWSTMHFAFNHLRLCYPPQVSKIKNVVGFVGSFFNFSCWSCFSAFRSSGFFSVVRFMQAIFHIYLLWGTNPVSFSSVILAIPSYFVSVRPVLSMLQGRP